jgi:hypothetical protein
MVSGPRKVLVTTVNDKKKKVNDDIQLGKLNKQS